jgi:uncharacterized FlgJ-related protein
MNTLPVLCATLSLLCSGVFNWDFEYTNRQEFIRGIKDCAVAYNSHLQDFRRVPLELTLVQALHESGADGNSRFAKEGNNFFGIKALDDEEYMLSLDNSGAKVRIFTRKCDSVIAYTDLLNESYHYEDFRNERLRQYIEDEVDIEKLIETLSVYAEDKKYIFKLKDMAYTLRKEGIIENGK